MSFCLFSSLLQSSLSLVKQHTCRNAPPWQGHYLSWCDMSILGLILMWNYWLKWNYTEGKIKGKWIYFKLTRYEIRDVRDQGYKLYTYFKYIRLQTLRRCLVFRYKVKSAICLEVPGGLIAFIFGRVRCS